MEVRLNLSSRPRIRTVESLVPYGDLVGTVLATEFAETPRVNLRFRVYR